MTVELRPLNVACNLSCTYCYQEPQRQITNNQSKGYDIDKMLQEVDKVGHNFNVFGGEALLVPKKDLERLWEFGLKKFNQNGIQTNGTLIDDDHIELFKKYKVYVGVSVDGPDELNSLREVRGKEGNDQATYEATKKTIQNIERLKKENIPVGVIITLHRLNGTKEKIPKLLEFVKWLHSLGISGNFHALEVDKTMPDQEKHVLTQEENAELFITLAKFVKEHKMRWKPFSDMEDMLLGDDSQSNCIWNRCDSMNTSAVYGIEGNGSLSNCGRTAKEGIDWYKANDHNYSRYISLYNTPDEMGGCKGCRFWLLCGGSCVGEAIDGDFRNKTIHCHTQYELLSYYEQELLKTGVEPITTSEKRTLLEKISIKHLSMNHNISLRQAIKELEKSKKQVVNLPVKKTETTRANK
ncbi:radical SAM protein [Chengkuizengella axinellae]|uniref:Radical SAM protein n=1 Tax=Chengkuizengella axinellae TaxID=3064388 RepID=A0ABT9IWF6_9BACL|nr:radical SAM protein [Chengkuizengella sp. 2205SS18-9]MDP5273698.1 radical SAM protein [Chengkuizengella sp. 2205SS18-9]